MFQMLMHILMLKKCIYVVNPHSSLLALFGFSFVESCFISFHHITIIRGFLQEPANVPSQHLSLFVTWYLFPSKTRSLGTLTPLGHSFLSHFWLHAFCTHLCSCIMIVPVHTFVLKYVAKKFHDHFISKHKNLYFFAKFCYWTFSELLSVIQPFQYWLSSFWRGFWILHSQLHPSSLCGKAIEKWKCNV